MNIMKSKILDIAFSIEEEKDRIKMNINLMSTLKRVLNLVIILKNLYIP